VRFFRHADAPAPDPSLRLVVGLGNPGGKYERTRHNVGFMVVNELAQRAGLTFKSSKQRADIARGTIEGLPMLLAQPQTYMNESGDAVSRLVQYYHVDLRNLLVVCDDLDLPFGTLRLRPSGSSGGNNGLKSVIRSLGTEDFTRMRVGVGRPPGNAVNYVLAPFTAEQQRELPELLHVAGDAVLAALREGVLPAMNEYNRSWAGAEA
jgi:PTH1 family peptidyl-tRNA hydrolase